ncbi:hypothetical protein SASPL_127176 [Salvia splendens]|uniref:Splicing factor 3B subunit 1 domain-containing protein n=1 Tax=Salvia splendens TaxID=180675 RepID=A0A8X8XK63_SALSN|nr:hypothetical protein SASPL_127176 [Salvia splendens]
MDDDLEIQSSNKFEGYEQSIAVNEDDDNADPAENEIARKTASFTAPKQYYKETLRSGEEDEMSGFKQPGKIIDREDDYRRTRLNRIISPERNDPFQDKTPGPEVRTYVDVMKEEALKCKEEEKRNRWDMSQDENAGGTKKSKAASDWDMPNSTPGIGRWDATPTPGRIGDATPSLSRKNRWDETPTPGRLNDSESTPAGGVTPGATPAGMAWDAAPKLGGLATPTPKRQRSRWDETPATMGSATPGATPAAVYTPGVTPFGAVDMAIPTPNALMRSAMTPEQYNLLRWEKDIEERNRPLTGEELDSMFPEEGYKILEPPASNVPIRSPARKLLATPTPMGTPLYNIPEENRGQQFDVPKELPGGLPFMKPEDYQYFGSLLNEENEEELSPEEHPLWKIKRHLLVKVIDRVLYKLDELVPGLATMIAAMRPDIDNIDEYVRNTTARAFSVVASALGIPALLPFLKSVCQSKKSWQARHTGIKIVLQIAVSIGCAVLPHLRSLVEIIERGLNDENQKVRTITALSLAALTEAAAPYGIESFDSVLKPLWKGIRSHRGKVLAAFLKAIGFIIPLMDAIYASYYTKEVMFILIHEFQSPDEEMKKIVLKVVKQCDALDRRNCKQLVETTVEIANKVGVADIVGKIVEDLKDESEPYRRMVMETIEKVVANLGASDIDARLEELLIDGILYAFQEQTSDDANVMLNGFCAVVNSLGQRVKPYLPQICVWRRTTDGASWSPHVINAVMKAIEGMRVALGTAVVLNYCLQGLFHPARKVREVYWKIYNSLYISAQDALVASYPVLEDEDSNVFSRPELHMFV